MPASGSRALAERLAEAKREEAAAARRSAAVEAHVLTTSHPARAHATGRRWLLPTVIGLAAVLAVAAVGSLAYSNKTRADRWEDRAFRLERNTEQLNGLLIERSTQLNERTRELNQIAAKVARTQGALDESESDVASLSERQRELAAEKAAVEDSRASLVVQAAALDAVASELVACNDGLLELLGYIARGDSASADAVIGGVAADCDAAEVDLAEYRARYG
jgi:TolA-binding protein